MCKKRVLMIWAVARASEDVGAVPRPVVTAHLAPSAEAHMPTKNVGTLFIGVARHARCVRRHTIALCSSRVAAIIIVGAVWHAAAIAICTVGRRWARVASATLLSGDTPYTNR